MQARRELDLLRRQVKKVFDTVDLLITPTMPSPPVVIAQGADPSAVSNRNRSPFNLLGLPAPAISVPCGFTTSGLPIGAPDRKDRRHSGRRRKIFDTAPLGRTCRSPRWRLVPRTCVSGAGCVIISFNLRKAQPTGYKRCWAAYSSPIASMNRSALSLEPKAPAPFRFAQAHVFCRPRLSSRRGGSSGA
jgi:hypothetical protein